MHEAGLILTLVAALGAALIFGFLAFRLKLPPIVGYLLAGVLIGPHTPGFVADRALAEQFAEVGVVLLMFGVGMHFHIKDLAAVRRVAVTGALVQISAAVTLGAAVAHSFGWSWDSSLMFGITLSVASTVVLTRVLFDNRDLQTLNGRIAIGWLIVQDIITVFLLVVLPVLAGGRGATGEGLALAIGTAAVKLVLLTWLALWPVGRLIARLLGAVARTNSRELFTLTVLVIALGLAVGSAKVFGVSMALGAFLAGVVVGKSEFSYRAASEALPMRDAFAVLFFVSVGMLFDPNELARAPWLIAAMAGIVLLGSPLTGALTVLALGYGSRVALRVAVALSQIGEFSFILAALGTQLGLLPAGFTGSVVAVSMLTIVINPLLYRTLPRVERAMAGRPKRWFTPRRPSGIPAAKTEDTAARAVVVGYGPVGETVARLLEQEGVKSTVVELNLDTVRRLTGEGVRAVYGDACRTDVLREAGIEKAIALVLSPPGAPECAEIIRAARELNPKIQVLARAEFVSGAGPLRAAGADEVFSGEAEVAIAMVDAALRRLGATPEQMDQERERVRADLYGGARDVRKAEH